MYLSDHAIQKGFVFLQMATEQADPPRVENARDVVPLLQEQPARCIKDNSCRNLANARVHRLTSRYGPPSHHVDGGLSAVSSAAVILDGCACIDALKLRAILAAHVALQFVDWCR